MPKRRTLRHEDKMKGSDGEVKGHEKEKRKVKKSKTDEEMESSTSSAFQDFNPFLVEPILRKLLKKVDKVAQLKDLRKMCVLWDKVNIEELEDRAFKGKLKAIDFEWKNRYPAASTKKMAQEELVQFLKDTRSIPQLFRSFKFNIPESLKILQGHTSDFFSNYHIYGVELITPNEHLKYCQVAIDYFLSLLGPNLKDIKILRPTSNYHGSFEPHSRNWPKPKQELVLPFLEKLIIEKKLYGNEFTDFFKSILAREGSGSSHITSLALTSLPGADIGSFPGLDPTRMTRLDIGVGSYDMEGGGDGGFKGTSIALKYTKGLMTLVEKGMKLLDLGLKLDSDHRDTPASLAQNLPSICSNLTHFFATQSSTLTTLNLRLEFECSWSGSEDEIGAEVATYGKIQLPIFQALHTLSFHHRLEMGIANHNFRDLIFSLFEPTHSLPLHFPSLVNLTFDSECSMGLFFDNSGLMEQAGDSRLHLNRLEIGKPIIGLQFDFWNEESRGNWDMLYGSLIGSVDYLRVPNEVLEEVSIPWADSLRELRTEYVSAPLKLAHLKKLEALVIDDCRWVGYKPYVNEPTGDTDSDCSSDCDNHQEVVTEYLSLFSEAKQLNLTYIKFTLEIEEGVEKEFVRYFPFPVQFEEDLEDDS